MSKEKQEVTIMNSIVYGLIGFAVGCIVQRMAVYEATGKVPPDICACCQWKAEQERLRKSKTDRHAE